jgi:hypothetical protein
VKSVNESLKKNFVGKETLWSAAHDVSFPVMFYFKYRVLEDNVDIRESKTERGFRNDLQIKPLHLSKFRVFYIDAQELRNSNFIYVGPVAHSV